MTTADEVQSWETWERAIHAVKAAALHFRLDGDVPAHAVDLLLLTLAEVAQPAPGPSTDREEASRLANNEDVQLARAYLDVVKTRNDPQWPVVALIAQARLRGWKESEATRVRMPFLGEQMRFALRARRDSAHRTSRIHSDPRIRARARVRVEAYDVALADLDDLLREVHGTEIPKNEGP